MRTADDVTSYCPPVGRITSGHFKGRSLRHTLRPNGTKDWLLIYTLAGGGEYKSRRGVIFQSRARDITLFQPGAFQDYQSSPQGWDLLFAHFLPRADWLEWLRWPEFGPGAMALRVSQEGHGHVRRALETVIRRSGGLYRRSEDLARNALEEALLWCDAESPRAAGEGLDVRVRLACDYLGSHLDIPFQEIALEKAVGLSMSRLRHLFRAQMGISMREFHEQQKMHRARHLLVLSSKTIAEIASDLGYDSPFYFSLRFKKETGQNPRDFRKLQSSSN